jgi:hypothetical protein
MSGPADWQKDSGMFAVTSKKKTTPAINVDRI